MQRLNTILLSTVCLVALASAPALAANSGVTAAVNQSAHGTAPGGAVRTIVIGDNVVTDEKIDTDGAGLVQILLPDGTTFTVGPNSSLTIDKFVYDPSANTAQVTASLARGVFRFIGGRTSKTEDGVTLNTPVGTVGIRGAVADISLTPNGQQLKAQIDLLFGKEVTLSGPGGLIDRIYKAGYSILIGADGKAQLVKTPPGSANSIQQALAGKPGTHGGAGDTPSDSEVANSDVPKTNSDQTPEINQPGGYTPPDLEAIELATIDFFDTHDDAQEILDGQGEGGGSTPPATVTLSGFSAGNATGSDSLSDGDFSSHSLSDGFPEDTNIHVSTTPKVADSTVTGGDIFLTLDDQNLTNLYFNFGDEGTYAGGDTIYPVSTGFGDANAVTTVTDRRTPISGATCTCDFLQWGTWNTQLNDMTAPGDHIDGSGYWVAGDITTQSQLDTAYPISTDVDATYLGQAIGTASGQEGTTVGNLSMTYHFSDRTGELHISDFGGYDFDTSLANGPGFSGTGTASDSTSHAIFGPVHIAGAFVNDGSTVAAGVIGNFDAETSGGSWLANGVFAGEQVLPN
jgi:hypothetical protein